MTQPTFEQIKTYAAKIALNATLASIDHKALHTYKDPQGKPLYWRIRLKCHRNGDKYIRPFMWNGTGFEQKEPPAPDTGKPLYGLERLATHPNAVVIITEGESPADALNKAFNQWGALDCIALTSGGAQSAKAADWQPLAGRTVYVFPDNDTAGAQYGADVVQALQGIAHRAAVLDIAPLNLPPKGDAVEWLQGGGNMDGLRQMMEAATDTAQANTPPPPEEKEAESEEKTSQASALVAFVLANAEVFHNANKDVFATSNATRETRRIDSRAFRDWLTAEFYNATGKAARSQSIGEALNVLGGLGRRGEEIEAHLRVAGSNGVYFIDLAEPERNRAIKVEAGHWEVVNDPPVRFIRTEAMQPLPYPEKGGDISPLWKIANIPEADQQLVIAWLCECFRPDTPFPVLELLGEQGSAKSTTQSALRSLIDPNACNLRAAPRASDDVFVSAGVSWLVSYENVSHLPPLVQDAFCTVTTGGGNGKRKLYSDTDESVITVKRPIVLNGISAAISQQDLVSRTITIETPTIRAREEYSELWRAFENSKAGILGGLLDVMAGGLRELPNIPNVEQRLIEFTRLGMAIAQYTDGTSERFLRHFDGMNRESVARTIDSSPVAAALMDWFDNRSRRDTTITMRALLDELERFKPQGVEGWVRSAKGLGDALRRAAPALRTLGIESKSMGKIGGAYQWRFSCNGNHHEKAGEYDAASNGY